MSTLAYYAAHSHLHRLLAGCGLFLVGVLAGLWARGAR